MNLLAMALLLFSVSPGKCAMESVPDLEKSMYKIVDGTPCVRLLNVFGEYGCANPGREKIAAPIQRLTSLHVQSNKPITALLPYSLLHIFLQKTVFDPSFAAKIAGVLVEFEHGLNRTEDSNPEKKFPLAEFSPYKDRDYAWNPSVLHLVKHDEDDLTVFLQGSGDLYRRYDFPIFLLSPESTALAKEFAEKNEQQNSEYPVNVAEFDLVMQTTKSDSHTTASCLREYSCSPLGGYSVWSALPPIDITSSPSTKPILLVVSSMDSASFFRDFTPGADSPLSGMIATLAAADALSKVDGIMNIDKQIVFLICTGEAWGYLGSRRFLLELQHGKASVAGLNASRIQQVLEVGSVGKATDGVFYAHTQEKQQVSPAVKEILEALQSSVTGLSAQVKNANEHNPGIPPSSLMSFIRYNSSIAGAVLEEFDTSFTNKYYHSHLDNRANVNVEAIHTAASIVARTVYQLSNSGNNNSSSSNLSSIIANASLIQELVSCLLTSNPGMECHLVSKYITPSQKSANHYVGVLLGDPDSDSTSANLVDMDDTAKFIWNFLSDRTQLKQSSSMKKCLRTCENPNEMCIAAISKSHKGYCVLASTRYVPAYSSKLRYELGLWHLNEEDDDDVDPVWTESFWQTINLRIYLQESPSFDRMVLVTGCCVTVVSAFIILSTRSVFRKRLKRA